MYHKISPLCKSDWWVSVDNFYRQLLELSDYQIVYLSDYDKDNPKQAVITFDDGYADLLYFAAPLLKKFNFPFEVFINGSYLGKTNVFDAGIEPPTRILSIPQLRELKIYGGRMEWHGVNHRNLNEVTDQKTIQHEITVPNSIRKLDPKGFRWFSYPHGAFNEHVKKAVKAKFEGAVSCNQGNDQDIYCLNRNTVTNISKFKRSKVAVIITNFNYGNYLVEAISSVLNQTLTPDEILIADDCSTDNSDEIIKSFLEKYPERIKYLHNKHHLGIVRNQNQAIKHVSSDYICFLDADNYFLSNYIEETKRALDSDPQTGIAYTDFALFGPRAQIKYKQFPPAWRKSPKSDKYFIIRFPSFSKSTRRLMQKRNFIHGNSMFRKSAYLSAGGYTHDERMPEDHSLFLRIINKGWGAKKARNTLLAYRQHSRNQENDRFNYFAQLNFYKTKSRELEQRLQNHDEIVQELNKIRSSKLWLLLFCFKNPTKIWAELHRRKI